MRSLATPLLTLSCWVSHATAAAVAADIYPVAEQYASRECRNIPGDPNWPSVQEWDLLNQTVNGRLIRTIPIGSVCHDPDYNEEACQALAAGWVYTSTFLGSPADGVAPYFQNQSCDPFTSVESPCAIGNDAVYSINVTQVSDIQAGVLFASKHNIRLNIKNTGHDLLGKSTGKGALSLWVHHLNSYEFIDKYDGPGKYTGPAARVGAGVLFNDILSAASERGVRLVAGTCPTVAMAGGFAAGGGHGILTPQYGLAADTVLEWEVVTAAGAHLVATPWSNPELYWALSGGGGGTFGVVVSVTVQTYPDAPMGGASTYLDINSAGGAENFWNAVTAFQSSLGAVVDTGTYVAYSVTPTALNVYGIAVPDGNLSVVNETLQPVKTALASNGTPLTFATTNHTGYLDYYNSYFREIFTVTPEAQVTGGRLVPRKLLESPETAETVTQAFKAATEAGFSLICVALKADKAPLYPNAVFPVWRSALLECVVSSLWNFTLPWSDMLAVQAALTDTVMPQIEEATPGGGSYLNEANFQQPDWQEAFYGSNYGRLSAAKEIYDPTSLFYAQTAVGSDVWAQDSEGRLCRT
ncbi:FAD-binding domain-containing protein [Biscogniauxia mediterranea]|nr:FAD-binding domain-containing protein [Biscogniauxia mediterranea]